MRRHLAILLACAGAAVATGAEAQTFRYMAFGDSITCGKWDNNDSPCRNGTTEPGPFANVGYPDRLRNSAHLNCDGTVDCQVYNHAKPGEKTGAGVTRIECELTNGSSPAGCPSPHPYNAPYDVVLLMHGTNNVCCGTGSGRSNSTIVFNLEQMEDKATAVGVDTLHASIIHFHPDSNFGTKEPQLGNLRDLVEGTAISNDRWFADPYDKLCPGSACFNNHYAKANNPNENGLHPDASGYDIMASEFLFGITQHLVPDPPTGGTDNGTTLTWNETANTTWYQVKYDNSDQAWTEGQSACSNDTCSWTIPNLTAGNHDWQVRGRNPHGRSQFSTEWSFTCSNVNVPDGTVSGNQTETGCIITAASVTVAGPNGDLTLDAGVRIKLRDGFTVKAGGELHARVGP